MALCLGSARIESGVGRSSKGGAGRSRVDCGSSSATSAQESRGDDAQKKAAHQDCNSIGSGTCGFYLGCREGDSRIAEAFNAGRNGHDKAGHDKREKDKTVAIGCRESMIDFQRKLRSGSTKGGAPSPFAFDRRSRYEGDAKAKAEGAQRNIWGEEDRS